MSTTNELFNSFCLALREDLMNRKRQTGTTEGFVAAIDDIVADIEVQADEAVARIQAMATTGGGCCDYCGVELNEADCHGDDDEFLCFNCPSTSERGEQS